MSNYINADDLRRILLLAPKDATYTADDVFAMIDAVKPADVHKVVHAHWVRAERRGCVTYHNSYAECSNCHGEPLQFCRDFKYCPHCGAKMDGGDI